jgi:hypothetical protein
MIKIAFHTPQLDVRGTCGSLYDYAHYNETLLNNKSVIVVPKSSFDNKKNDEIAVKKFKERFEIVMYTTFEELENLIADCQIIYYIKYGKKDGFKPIKGIKSVIHCVFDLSDPHGDVYAAVSKTLAAKYKQKLFVPHMIGLEPSKTNENMRKELGIPEDAIVFGRHGGEDTFDLQFVKDGIKQIIRECPNIYFVFVNTPRFDTHSNIFFLEKIIYPDEKNKFICSCDAMIHAQSLGETFGLSIGEFSVNNKPIVTYGGDVWNDNYKKILKNNAFYYYDAEGLIQIIKNFKKEDYVGKKLNFYTEYEPAKVMNMFKKIFINDE